jgi:hypothetical protein
LGVRGTVELGFILTNEITSISLTVLRECALPQGGRKPLVESQQRSLKCMSLREEVMHDLLVSRLIKYVTKTIFDVCVVERRGHA